MSEESGHHGERVIEEIQHLSIPHGWMRISVGEAGDVRLGRQRSPKNRSADHPIKYIRAANITWTGLALDDVLDMEFRPAEQTTYRLQPGDVLLSEASGSASEVGKSAIWNGELENCCFQNTVIRFRPKAVNAKYALLVFQHFARSKIFAKVSKGVGIHHLSADRFASMPFLLPPLAEQERIVTSAEEAFSNLDAGIAALKRAKANLKRYRAAVLKAAVEGNLTEEWRAKHPNTEPASKLLNRILTERRQKWEADQLAKFASAGKEPPKNWREKYSEPTLPDLDGLAELPIGWCWASVDQTSEVQGGIQKQPKRAPGVNSFPFLRVANVHRNRLELDEVHRIELFGSELERLRLLTDDLLVVEGNGSKTEIGRSAIWAGEIEDCVHQNHIIRVRFKAGSSRYLNAYWNSPLGNGKVMEQAASTSGLYTLSVTKVCSLPIPLPPVIEQQQIVSEVEQRLSVISAAETEIERGLLRSSRLRQSILKQAFEGQLVSQNPADEPASELLSRIRRQSRPSVQKAVKPSLSAKRPRIDKENLGRAIAYCLYRRKKPHGRTWLAKVLVLGELHVGVPLNLRPNRFPHGPLDDMIFDAERMAKKAGWFNFEKGTKPKEPTRYEVTNGTAAEAAKFMGLLGDRKAAFDNLIENFDSLDSDGAELFGTVYTAWNDLLIDGRSADHEAIIAEFYAWDDSKANFTRNQVLNQIAWLRKHDYVPTGNGPRTIVLDQNPEPLSKPAKNPRKA